MLEQYRVIDLTNERGHLASFILAQMGADVVAVEPPTGSNARHVAPFAGDIAHPERSLTHWAYNRGKRSVVLDYQNSPDDRAELKRLIAGADILFESFEPSQVAALGLTYDQLAQTNPALIHVSITAFGSDGPKANWASSDLIVQASAVNMAITGDTDRAPLRAGGVVPQAFNNAASEAAGAALIALWERQTRSGLGQHISMSAQQSMTQSAQSNSLASSINAIPAVRSAGGVQVAGINIQLMWPCADGHASVTFLFGDAFVRFTQNLMDWVFEEGFCDEATRDKNWTDYTMMLLDGREPVSEYERTKDCLTAFFATKTKAELLEAAMTRRLLIVPIWTIAEVTQSPQLADRGYWETLDHGDGGAAGEASGENGGEAGGEYHGQVSYPGAFAKFSKTPLRVLPQAPRLGEHNDEVLAEPPRSVVLGTGPASTGSAGTAPANASPTTTPPTTPPLAGVKVLDLMWAMAGPAASRVLADYGADIIRVESANKLDAIRSLVPFKDDVGDPEYSGGYNNLNAGKRGLALDMSKPEAINVMWDLIDWADVVMESFSPKAMAAWGLSYEEIRQRKPDIIMISSCLMGQTGPLALLAGFGTMAAAISGFFYPVGWADRAPAGSFGAYTDYTSPRWLIAALMGALEHRRQTGEGQYVDLSQAEAALHLSSSASLDYTVNGRVWERDGNRDTTFAPQGVYATAAPAAATPAPAPAAANSAEADPEANSAEDEDAPALSGAAAATAASGYWIAISCTSDDQWRALAQLIGQSDLADLSATQRHERHDELDELIAAYVKNQDAIGLAEQLQQAGVAAHAMQNSPELAADPQAIHRNHFLEVAHATQGTTFVEGTRFQMSRTPAVITHGGPTFGEHSFEILTDVLGYDTDRIAELAGAELLE